MGELTASVVRVTAKPRLVSTGAEVTLYMAGGGDRSPYFYGGVHYAAGIAQLPRFRAELDWGEDGWTGGVTPTSGRLDFAPSTSSAYSAITTNYFWNDAAITVEVGEEGINGTAPASWATVLIGTVAGISAEGGVLQITIADLSKKLDKPLAPGTFAGTGGIEGSAEATGRVKRRSYGTVYNVEARILDKANSVYEYGDPAFKASAVLAVKDMGQAASPAPTEVLWQGTVAATFTALQAAVAAPGSAVVAPSIQCLKWWTIPVGPLTVDLVGESGERTAAQLVETILAEFGQAVNAASATALSTDRPGSAGVHIGEGRQTVSETLDRLLLGVSSTWVLDPSGVVFLRALGLTSPVESLTSLTVSRTKVFAPHRKRRVGYKRNNRQHNDTEIAATIAAVGTGVNRVANSLFERGTTGWINRLTPGGAFNFVTGTNNGRRYIGVDGSFSAAGQTASICSNFFNKDFRIPVLAGERLLARAFPRINVVPAGSTWTFVISYLDEPGNPINGSSHEIASGVDGLFPETLKEVFTDAPPLAFSAFIELTVTSGAAGAYDFALYTPEVSGAPIDGISPRLNPGPSPVTDTVEIFDGAGLGSTSVLIDPPEGLIIYASSTGEVKTGELPREIQLTASAGNIIGAEPSTSQVAAKNGVASLDGSGKVPVSQLPDFTGGSAVVVRVSDFIGTDREKIIQAVTAAENGDIIQFDPAGTTTLTESLVIGQEGVVAANKNLRFVADGHTFILNGPSAQLRLQGPISEILRLSVDYTKGTHSITVTATPAQMLPFTRNAWFKIISDAIDGWNRNNGDLTTHYRLAEWNQVAATVDNGNGTYTIKFWSRLKFTRGFRNDGDAENMTEVDSYTVAMNARILAPLYELAWRGGHFYQPDARSHLGLKESGWYTTLFTIMAYNNLFVENLTIGPGTGPGLALQGCPNFLVNNYRVFDLPDTPELNANDDIDRTGWHNYLGYGMQISGCWGGVVNDLRSSDVRHAVSSNSATAAVNNVGYRTSLVLGRVYGTRIVGATVGGQYSGSLDTHHDAHAWVFDSCTVHGTQEGAGISLRGPGHTVIEPRISGHRGIYAQSEYASNGNPDVPGLVGNGNKWMTSARIIGGDFDLTGQVIWAVSSRVSVVGGLNARCRTHLAFQTSGGRIEFESGVTRLEITGEVSQGAININNETNSVGAETPSAKGIFEVGDVAATFYGITWEPGMTIHEGAAVEIDAKNAYDIYAIWLAKQLTTTQRLRLDGRLSAELPGANVSDVLNHAFRIGNTATLRLTGNAALSAKYPDWERGRIRLGSLAPAVGKKVFTFPDIAGSAAPFVAIAKVYALDMSLATHLVAEFALHDIYTVGSASEVVRLVTGSATDFEAGSNIDYTVTAPTAEKIGLGFLNGIVTLRHAKAATTFEDVWVELNILRQLSDSA